MVSGNMVTHVFNYMYMRIQSSWNYFIKSYKVSLTDQDRSLYIYNKNFYGGLQWLVYTYIYIYKCLICLIFFFTNKENNESSKKYFQLCYWCLLWNQQYLIRIWHDPLPGLSNVIESLRLHVYLLKINKANHRLNFPLFY